MGNFKKNIMIMLAMLLGFVGFPATTTHAAVNDYLTVTKRVNPASITTEQEAEVSLSIQGTPPVNVVQPNDVILIIDKSGSMRPENNNGEDKMAAAKEAAKGFIDLMDFTKHQVGIVDFSSTNSISTFDLTTDAAAAKNYVDTINANGGTATGDAIDKAINLLQNHRPEAHPVIVIMTDGDATEPKNNAYNYAKEKAQAAKDAGIVFYTIALLKSTENPDTSGPNLLLREMATTSAHHHFVLGSTGLKEIYAAIVKEIGLASAYDVTITDIVGSDFEIVPGSYDNNIPKPEVNGSTLTWKIAELKNTELTFTYKVKPKDVSKAGNLPLTNSDSKITYKDYAGSSRSKLIPSLTLQVKLPAPIITSIAPNKGPVAGGGTVTIRGEKFVSGAKVQFGSNFATEVKVVSPNEITAAVPAGAQGKAAVTVTNPDGQKATSEYNYEANPVISSVDPNSGPLVGGNIVNFKGNNFMNGVKVTFGGKLAELNMYTSSSYFKVTVPASDKAGAVDIVLTNPDGTTVTLPNGYKYIEPPVEKLEITTVNPNSGELVGGETVVIDGKLIDPAVKIFFGDKAAELNTYYSNSRIKVKVPAGTVAGPVDVKAVNPDGKEAIVKAGYTYKAAPIIPAPEITTIMPNSGLLKGGETVVIDGKNFKNGLKVFFGSVEAKVQTLYTDTKITIIAPAGTVAGEVDVKVVNPDQQQAVKIKGYNYLETLPAVAPTITKLTPNSGPTEGGTAVYIDGKDFVEGLKVYFGTVEAPVGAYYSSSRIKVTSPVSTVDGEVDVKIVNPDTLEAVSPKAFKYIAPPPPQAPTITKISPNSGLVAGGTVVYIDGANFVNGLKVYFGDQEAPVSTFYSSIRIKVTAPASVVDGAVNVKIINPDKQEGVQAGGYTYMLPPPEPVTITKITPNTGLTVGGELVTLDGVNFKPGAIVKFGAAVAQIDYFYGSNRVRVKAPASNGYEGSVDVTLTNTDTQTFTYTNGYTYAQPVPEITNISPNHGPMAGGTVVYVDGKNFDPSMNVTIDGKSVPITTYYSSSRIKITTPASAAPGEVPVIVTLATGATGKAAFTYDTPPVAPPPAITKINPSYGPVAGGTIIYVDGTGFQNGIQVFFDGVEGELVTYYSGTRLKIKSPAGSGAGTVQIKLINPDGKESNSSPFEYR
ncbi:IPT/TIG domain-containing protein [Bacillus thuringiensis]|nr:IPT/TIG domain-containing protein [Bacillus thuringiensis]